MTEDEYRQQVLAYAELAVDFAKSDVSRLAELCDRLDELPPAAYRRIVEHMTSDAVRLLPEQDRLQVWSRIDALAKRHRKFAGADWALPLDEIQALEHVAARIAPQDPFFRHQKLFSERWGELLEEKGNFEQQAEELERRRHAAVQELLSVGVPHVLDFARTVEAPWRVGIALGSVAPPEVDHLLLPTLLGHPEDHLSKLVGAFALARVRIAGWKWFDDLSAPGNWSREQYGRLLALLPFSPEAWSRASRLLGSDESAYWQHTPAEHYELREGFETAAEHLLQYGRPQAALRCLHRLLDEKQPLNHGLIIRALLAAVSSEEPPRQLDSHDIVELIKALQVDPSTDREALYGIEWAYLPLLNKHQHAEPATLARRLADDPTAFCDVIRLVFRPRLEGTTSEAQEEGATDRQKEIAANGYTLLHEWATPPGLQVDGNYDGTQLESWLDAVKKNAAATGHINVALSITGQVLTHVPPDRDGLWINHSAAAVLNAADAAKMRAGFRSQVFNSRGVHWVDPSGKPERGLAAKYRSQAEALESAGYARFAATMRELAETYDREAERVASRHDFDD